MQQRTTRSSKNVLPNQEVNYGSDLYDTEIVFTGELMSMNRKDAIQRAVNNGAVVGSGVTKRTNFLIVGISDFIDFDKGKRAELTFVPNPLKEVNLRSAESFNKFISLSIKPRYKKQKDKQGNVVARRISAYRIEVKAKAPLLKSFESKKITDKIIQELIRFLQDFI